MRVVEISCKRHRGRGGRNDTFEARATVSEEEDQDVAMDDLYDYLALAEQRQLHSEQQDAQQHGQQHDFLAEQEQRRGARGGR